MLLVVQHLDEVAGAEDADDVPLVVDDGDDAQRRLLHHLEVTRRHRARPHVVADELEVADLQLVGVLGRRRAHELQAGDGPEETPLVNNGQRDVGDRVERGDGLLDRRRVLDEAGRGVHEGLGRAAAHHRLLDRVVQHVAAALQLFRVNRRRCQVLRHPRGEGDRQQHGEDQGILAGHLDDDEGGRQRRPRGGGERRAHPDDAVDRRRGRRERLDGQAHRHARRRADRQRRREHAARAADRDRVRRVERAAQAQQTQHADPVFAGQHVELHRRARAVHRGEHPKGEAQEDRADGRPRPFGPVVKAVDQVFDEVKELREQKARQPGDEGDDDHPHEGVRGRHPQVIRQVDVRAIAQEDVRDHRRGDRREHDVGEGRRGQPAEDDLHRETRAGQRGIERRRDAGRGTARREQDDATPRQVEQTGNPRAQRRPHLDNRPFAAHRAAAAKRQRRRDDLHRGDPARDLAAVADDGQHDLGDAVAASAGREFLHQRPIDEGGNDGDKNNQPAGPPEDAVGLASVRRIVGVARHQPRPALDAVVEQHRRAAHGGADQQRQQREDRVVSRDEVTHGRRQTGKGTHATRLITTQDGRFRVHPLSGRDKRKN